MVQHPLYLIPGTMCDARLWQPMLAHLPYAQAAICDYRNAETLDGMVETLLDQAPEESHLVGFSLGGYLAIRAALRKPERFKSLTVIAASPYGLTPDEKDLRRRNAEMLGRLKYLGMSNARLRQFVHESRLKDTELTDTIRRMEQDMGQEVLVRQLLAPVDRPDLSQAMAGLKMPVRFIMATDDALVPIGAIERLANKLPAIKLERFEKTGHMIPLEVPEILANLIDDFTN